MRNLKSTDLFAALRVVREIGIKEEMQRLAAVLQTDKVSKATQTEVGMELLMTIFANCGSEAAEKAFFAFLSGPTEIPVSELRDMDLTEFADTIKELVAGIDIDHWRGFFTSLAGLIRKQI